MMQNRLYIIGFIVVGVISALAGALITVTMYRDRQFTVQDLVEAHSQGEKNVLDLSKPSEKLEAVCAAMWLQDQQKKNNSKEN